MISLQGIEKEINNLTSIELIEAIGNGVYLYD